MISKELRLPAGGDPPLTVARRCLAGSSGNGNKYGLLTVNWNTSFSLSESGS
jgi:hypothetical protein